MEKILNINTATLNELEKLPGIGRAKAAAIVEHRKFLSSYESINDLKSVEGITKTLVTRLQEEYKIIFTDNETTHTKRNHPYLKRTLNRNSNSSSSENERELLTPDKRHKHDLDSVSVHSPPSCTSIDSSISNLLPSCAVPGHTVRRRLHSEAVFPPEGVDDWLSQFQTWSREERLYALNDLVGLCDMSVVRHLMAKIEPHFQRDFISLLPKELALYVLSFLQPIDLCRAAKTCRYWRILAEDNL